MRLSIDLARRRKKISSIIMLSNEFIDFRNKGNMKKLLETIILSKNEDIPRFLKFYDE